MWILLLTLPIECHIIIVYFRDLCINMNNHQNAIFYPLDNFIKHSHNFAMIIFHKITNSAKLVILLIIPTYAKVSLSIIFFL
ncbi:hypothetical protein [uncultured Gammaproteobacteria bacterium]|nr:hypothetical protein [uncultured Gammaproteobacteria bacterium]